MLSHDFEEHVEELLERCECRDKPGVVCRAWGCEEVRVLWEEVKRLRVAYRELMSESE